MKVMIIIKVLILSLFIAKSESNIEYEELIDLMQDKIKDIKTISLISHYSAKINLGDSTKLQETSTIYDLSFENLKFMEHYVFKMSFLDKYNAEYFKFESNINQVIINTPMKKIDIYEGNFELNESILRLIVEKKVDDFFNFYGNYEEYLLSPEDVKFHEPTVKLVLIEDKEYIEVLRNFNFEGNLTSGATHSNSNFRILINKINLLPHSFEITRIEHKGAGVEIVRSLYLKNQIENLEINHKFSDGFFEYEYLLNQGFHISRNAK